MPHNNQHIALLLFTRTPEEEVRYKSLAPQCSVAKQQAVVTKLIQESRQVLDETGLPYFIYSSANQVGSTFGERLYAAFADLFSRGYQQVIAIGNDCPQLKPHDLLKAANCLQHQDIVTGPDNSGGVYLLGFNRRTFESCSSFDNIRWSTNQVFADIAALFGLPENCLAVLPKYADINNYRDLYKALQRKFFRAPVILFFKFLFNLFISNSGFRRFDFIPEALFPHLFFRGPPSRV